MSRNVPYIDVTGKGIDPGPEVHGDTEMKSTGFIFQDTSDYAIFGAGSTEAEAWAQVVDGVGQFHDFAGNDTTADDARETQFSCYPATAALLAQVEDEGGAIAWGVVDGIACTIDEEEAANA